MTKKMMTVTVAFVSLAWTLSAEVTGTPNGAEYVVNVDSGREPLSAGAVTALTSGAYTRLVKTGGGTLVSQDLTGNNGFRGEIVVNAGTFEVPSQEAMGTKASAYPAVTLGVGAVLSLTAASNVEIEIRQLTLTGDATISGSAKAKYSYNTVFDMGGHILTLSNGQLELKPSSISNPGDFIVTKGTFCPECVLSGTDHTITLKDSGVISLWFNPLKADGTATYPITWPLRVENTANNNLYFRSSGGNARYDGDIEIAKDCVACVADSPNYNAYIYGDISGEGSLKDNGPNLYLYGKGTWSGRTQLIKANASLHAITADSLPSDWTDRADYPSGSDVYTLYLRPGSASYGAGWSASQVATILGSVPSNVGVQLDVVTDGSVMLGSAVFDSTQTTSGYSSLFGASGEGAVTMATRFVSFPSFNFHGTQTLAFSGDGQSSHELGTIRCLSGTTTFGNMGYMSVGDMYVGSRDSLVPAELHLSGNTAINHSGLTANTSAIGVGVNPNYYSAGNIYRGVLTVGEGVSLTNRIMIGIGKGSGGVYQRGGIVYAQTGSSGDMYVGGSSWGDSGSAQTDAGGANGYYELSSGKLVVTGYMLFGRARNGFGSLHLQGGEVNVSGSGTLAIGQAGMAVYYQTGGKLQSSNGFLVCDATWLKDAAADGGEANATLSGTNALMHVDIANDKQVYLSGRSNSRSFLNLNDGAVLEAGLITRAIQTAGYKQSVENNQSFIGFNGGVARMLKTAALFGADWGASGNYAPTRITIYEKGGVIDTNGFDFDSRVAFDGPVGLGVTHIAIPDGLQGLVGAPVVTISGNGQGASAICEFDSITRTVTNIVVTSPGFNYSGTASATLSGGGLGAPVNAVVTLGAVAGGPFIKRGAGRLYTSAANTYSGGTRVEGGVLDFMAGGSAQFDGKPLVVARNASLVFRTATTIAPSKFSGAGMIEGANLVLTNGQWNLYAADLSAKAGLSLKGSLTLSSETVVTTDDMTLQPSHSIVIASSDKPIVGSLPTLDGKLTRDYVLRFSADRRQLRFVRQSGIIIVVR